MILLKNQELMPKRQRKAQLMECDHIPFITRIDSRLYAELQAWAKTEDQTVSDKIRYLLDRALHNRKTNPHSSKPIKRAQKRVVGFRVRPEVLARVKAWAKESDNSTSVHIANLLQQKRHTGPELC